jgi:hypothetical protein
MACGVLDALSPWKKDRFATLLAAAPRQVDLLYVGLVWVWVRFPRKRRGLVWGLKRLDPLLGWCGGRLTSPHLGNGCLDRVQGRRLCSVSGSSDPPREAPRFKRFHGLVTVPELGTRRIRWGPRRKGVCPKRSRNSTLNAFQEQTRL